MRVERPKQPEKEAAGSRHELGAARQAVTADVDPIDPPTENLMEEVLRAGIADGPIRSSCRCRAPMGLNRDLIRRQRGLTLRQREVWLAYGMLLPPILIVAAIVLFPVAADFWISFKDVALGDLQPPRPLVRARVQEDADAGLVRVQYRMRNSTTRGREIREVTLHQVLPPGFKLAESVPGCRQEGALLTCDRGTYEPGFNERLEVVFQAPPTSVRDEGVELAAPEISGETVNALTTFEFTLDNYRKIFNERQFLTILQVTVSYTFFGTFGAVVVGLLAALLFNTSFPGRSILRGLLLFPYVAPIVSVAIIWVFLLDPFNGVIGSLLTHFGVADKAPHFLGTRSVPIEFFGLVMEFPLALATVIVFEWWRYFPLSFLFILARMQGIPTELYDAAEVDGAGPLQMFRYVTLPQLLGVLSVLFVIRFIWTFNKFDDIFLLTSGAAGTRTLTLSVYEQAFALQDLGAGAAVTVIIFIILVLFVILCFLFVPREEEVS